MLKYLNIDAIVGGVGMGEFGKILIGAIAFLVIVEISNIALDSSVVSWSGYGKWRSGQVNHGKI